MTTKPDDTTKLAGHYTRADGERILKEGSIEDVKKLRAAIIESISHIESQLKLNPAAERTWVAKAHGAQRWYRQWLERISMRLSEGRPRQAVVLKGVGASSDKVAGALNELIARDCHIYAFDVVGADLVVIASEPRSA